MRIGVDIGGTKIEAVTLAATGVIAARERVPTPQGDYAGTVAATAALVHGLQRSLGKPASIGIGIPGTHSSVTGLVTNSNSVCLIGKPLQKDLEAAIGQSIRIANDANCFALSEAADGAAAGLPVVFGVILGTGVGGGLVVRGQTNDGHNGIAGEWGHNPLPAPHENETPGPSCYCGRHGCIEQFLSGPAFARDHATAAATPLETPVQIAAAAQAGDSAAQDSMGRYADRLARSLGTVINLIDPDAIVLGGGMSNITSLYEDVPRLWHRYVHAERISTALLPPRHGDSSGVRGAAWLWPETAQ
ncbi:MAG: ROK family protein [Alphaproteobacteria bacterium]|nr:ROK family protein [Alphaproteobacteria bacterium]